MTTHTAIPLTATYAAALAIYWWLHRTLPKQHRLRALMFLMTLPLVIVAVIATTNPLPGLLPAIQSVWRHGPAG